MMGYFSVDPLYHQDGEALEDGYTPLPDGIHRVQIVQHRMWLQQRAEQRLPYGLEVQVDERNGSGGDSSDDDESLFSDQSTEDDSLSRGGESPRSVIDE